MLKMDNLFPSKMISNLPDRWLRFSKILELNEGSGFHLLYCRIVEIFRHIDPSVRLFGVFQSIGLLKAFGIISFKTLPDLARISSSFSLQKFFIKFKLATAVPL